MDLPRTAARVMTLAQNADVGAARALARSALQQAADEPGLADWADLAALWYAAAVTERVGGEQAAMLEATDQCLLAAGRAGSPGWTSNALALRAVAHVEHGAIEAALLDLARSEVALDDCRDAGLRNWAHTGLGCAYIELRLYELALPHFEAALALQADPVPLPESRAIDLLNLAETRLRWADELERVRPDAGSDAEAEQLRAVAHGHAVAALEVAERTAPDAMVATLRALVLVSRPRTEAAATVEELRAELARPDHLDTLGGRAMLGAALARALWRVGCREEALAEAEAAAEVSEAATDWQVTASARWLHVEMQAEAGVPGSRSGREYARLLSRVLWQQRLSSLQGARAALDVERMRHTTALAQRAAREDPRTGVGNRRALDAAFAQLRDAVTDAAADATAPNATATSLVVVDLDDFKTINDTHGHVVGDEVLRAVADALRQAARADDLVARLGGDEFVVLAYGTDETNGRQLAARVDAVLRQVEVPTAAGPLRLAASVGVATAGPGSAVPDLLAQADASMYAVKAARHRLAREPEGV